MVEHCFALPGTADKREKRMKIFSWGKVTQQSKKGHDKRGGKVLGGADRSKKML